VNGVTMNAAWTLNIGTSPDARPPFVVSVASEVRSPADPLNPNSVDVGSSLIVEFSEPMVPQSVGHSATLNGFPFDANIPNPATSPPLPDTTITATVNTSVGRLFVPFDCVPLNVNNLATYRLTPLINLPANSSIDVVVRATSTNTNAPIDLSGNIYDGQDLDGDGVGDGADFTASFTVGPGPAIVNIPVSPEVIYWAPSAGNGIGAIDLNGWGLTTNTPGANAGIRERASIITKPTFDPLGTLVNPGGFGLPNVGIALWSHPGTGSHNRYWWPVGTGSYPYSQTANQSNQEGGKWEDPTDPGNPGTPVPGINEGSSGFETLCRDSNGEVILTGAEFGQVGNVQDLIVGDFLDRVYFDRKNFHATNALHVSFFGGNANTQGRNLISDPPTPNPPPTRYWVGLPQIDIALDQAHPTQPALLIEGEEVFTGMRIGGLAAGQNANAARSNGYVHLKVNTVNPNAADETIFPHQLGGTFGDGPGAQSATAVYTFSSRQQIGNFLYATDATSREVHAINSNTMRVIESFSLPDPTGLAISPDLRYLYVTNLSDDSMSVVGADPTLSDFHRELLRVHVGSGPRAIAVQPEMEDIFVCNYNANTLSIISPKTLEIRKTLDALIDGPFDVTVTERQEQPSAPYPFGWACGLYFAYVSNFTGNSVIVYESGPDGPQGIGIDNIRGSLPIDDSNDQLIAPRGVCFCPFANPIGLLAGGVYVAHRDEAGFGRVSLVQFTQQALFGPLPLAPPPGFFIPPGFTDRVFEITQRWGETNDTRLAGFRPTDVCLADLNTSIYQANPAGAPNFGGVGVPAKPDQTGFVNSKCNMRLAGNAQGAAVQPDRLYVAFEDSDVIQVLNPRQGGLIVNSVPGHQLLGTKKLSAYWRQ
jgi:hypothetical protein